jgi:hypothetical protein
VALGLRFAAQRGSLGVTTLDGAQGPRGGPPTAPEARGVSAAR